LNVPTILAIATLLVMPATLQAGEHGESAEVDRTVTVEATDFDFDPKKIKIEPSTTLKVVLVNKGNVTHSWAVPKLDKKSERIQPGKQTSITLSPEPGWSANWSSNPATDTESRRPVQPH
ncbi:MAG: cupredoxin domain-containing protein, partial [Bradymonadaceae bacterium]